MGRSVHILSIGAVSVDAVSFYASPIPFILGGLHTFVFVICSRLGDKTRATSEVEKSISMMAISPSRVSWHLPKDSVEYIRKPRDVPAPVLMSKYTSTTSNLPTHSKAAVVLIESNVIHSDSCPG
jgi:hypothetical protein